MAKQYLRLLVLLCVSLGIVLLVSHDLLQLSLTPAVVNQRPFIMELAVETFKNNSQTKDQNYTHYYNFSSNVSEKILHIGFLKVHKAGSTTMQNMFFRFGIKHNLTFVIPRQGNYFKMPSTEPVKKGGHYDILAVHSVFKKNEFDKILPPDKVNIGIVREPLDRMISAAYYYRDVFGVAHLRAVPKVNFIQELIDHPEKYEKGVFSETKNSMGRDFGFEPTLKQSDTSKILQKLEFLEKEFDLVLVVERFEESLVLMKRHLHWQMSDIVFITSNSHQHAVVNLSEAQQLKHKSTCFLDYAIYDFFSKLFELKIQAEGNQFQEEVDHFKAILQQVKSFCAQLKSTTETLEIAASKWNSEFKISPTDCEFMTLPEIKFINKLRDRHKRMNGKTR